MKFKIQRNQLTLSVVADNLIEGGDPMGSVWQRVETGSWKLEGGWGVGRGILDQFASAS